MQITINDTSYAVGVASVARAIRKEEKYRVTTEDGVVHREVRATYMDFALSVGNISPAAYDALIAALMGLDGDATIAVGGETYTGAFDGVEDSVLLEDDDGNLVWDELRFSFTGTVPLGV